MKEEKEEQQPIEEELEKKKSFLNPKVFLIGVPLFIVQLMVVYFVTANILLSKIQNTINETAKADTTSVESKEEEDVIDTTSSDNLGEHIYSVEDIIVNPAGTNGSQLLLCSVAFDLPSQEKVEELKGKEILIRDMIISILSGKTIHTLSDASYKDTLRTEIADKLQDNIKDVPVKKVYFGKYIIN